MSGGHFNYQDSSLKNEIFNWTDKPWNALEDREISELTWDLLNLLHEFDWYKSGDMNKERYLEVKEKFKKKWFSNRGVRVKQIVDTAIADVRTELYETFRIKDGDVI